MKKRLLTLSMVSLVAIGTLVSCSDVKGKKIDGKDVIVSVGGENYTADELFDQYSSTTTGAAAYYKAVSETLIRHYISGDKFTSTMEREVDSKLDSFTTMARSNASTNGTTYKSELSSLLDSEGVDSLAELREVYILEEKRAALEKEYYDIYTDSRKTQKNQNLIDLTNDWIEETAPYHVRHILVKTDTAGSSYYNGKITEAESKNIASAVKRLAQGNETFGQIAQTASDDIQSAAAFGDTGIMGKATGFVNEFKFAIFQYDAFLNSDVTSEKAKLLDIPEQIVGANDKSVKVEDYLEIGEIPYDKVLELEQFASTTRAKEGIDNSTNTSYRDLLDKEFDKESAYPRNLIYNEYFNNHGLSFITKGNTTENINKDRFKSLGTNVLNNKEVLVDENQNPILVTRAGTGSGESGYQGIHFIVIEQSALTAKSSHLDAYKKASGNESATFEDYLNNYYSFETPTTSTDVNEGTWARRFVTYLETSSTSYSDRAKELENLIKGFDANIEYRLYDYMVSKLTANGSLTTGSINPEVNTLINSYIEVTRAKTAYDTELSYTNSWSDYIRMLQYQDSLKDAKQKSYSNYIEWFK